MTRLLSKFIVGIVVVSVVFGIASAFAPLALMGFGIYWIIKGNSKNNAGKRYDRQTRRDDRRYEQHRTVRRNDVKTEPAKQDYFNALQTELIDKALSEYFKQNETLLITDEIYLKPEGGQYRSLNQLYVYLNQDCVASLENFRNNYPNFYTNVMNSLLEFSKQNEVQETVEIKPETNMSQAEIFIEKIDQLNIEIEHEEISNGLYQTSALLKHIQLIEKKIPDSSSKLTKLYQYYLPILVDILENYKILNSSAHSLDEFKKAEERLIKTIILVNEAMKTISSSLCEADFLNLSADMTTLESLLKKDGLVSEGTFSEVKLKAGDEIE